MLKPFSDEWRRLLRRLTRLTGDAADAEDALQSAFIRVETYRRQHEVREPRALLARAAVNIALDERRRTRHRFSADIDQLAETIKDSRPLQDEVLAAAERLRVVRAEIAKLPARTRDIFLMHRLEGMKYREIAEALGVSVSAVEKHIARASLVLGEAVRRLDAAS